MVPLKIVQLLVFALAILIVSMAVVMGGYALAQAIEPAESQVLSRVLLGVGLGCFVLMIIDALLLLFAVGVNQIESTRDPHNRQDQQNG